MAILETVSDVARARRARVVFPEAEEPRVAEAMTRLTAEGLAEPVPLALPSEAHVAVIADARGLKPALAARMVTRPLYRAAAMVACGEADAMVAGADSPTRRVIEAAGIVIGMSDGVTTPSSFFLMVFPDGRELIFADCAVTVAPDVAALADIATASAATASALLGSARVALLSYSTGTSGAGPMVDTVREAAEAVRARGVAARGPVQADAALNPSVAVKKGAGAGDANVLVFPSLDAGNIAYKLAQELGGAQAIGPFLQGFRKPVCDLSRGATVDDIVAATVVTIALA